MTMEKQKTNQSPLAWRWCKPVYLLEDGESPVTCLNGKKINPVNPNVSSCSAFSSEIRM